MKHYICIYDENSIKVAEVEILKKEIDSQYIDRFRIQYNITKIIIENNTRFGTKLLKRDTLVSKKDFDKKFMNNLNQVIKLIFVKN